MSLGWGERRGTGEHRVLSAGPSPALWGAERQPGEQPSAVTLLQDTHLTADKDPTMLQVGTREQNSGSEPAPHHPWGNASSAKHPEGQEGLLTPGRGLLRWRIRVLESRLGSVGVVILFQAIPQHGCPGPGHGRREDIPSAGGEAGWSLPAFTHVPAVKPVPLRMRHHILEITDHHAAYRVRL